MKTLEDRAVELRTALDALDYYEGTARKDALILAALRDAVAAELRMHGSRLEEDVREFLAQAGMFERGGDFREAAVCKARAGTRRLIANTLLRRAESLEEPS